jgi:hypothetical protein
MLSFSIYSRKEDINDARQSHGGSSRREKKLSTAKAVQKISQREKREHF